MPKTHAADYRLNLSFACQPVVLSAPVSDGKNPPPVRFTGVAYSGGVIPSYGWLGDVAIDLATLQNPDAQNIPVLVDHSTTIDNIAGKGTLSRVGNALHITGELTQATDAGKQITALMGEGFPLQLSVGMQASLRETTEATRAQQLNGQTLTVKAVFESARIIEVSFVPTGADPHTSAAQFSAQPLTPSPQPAPPATMKGVNMTRTPEDQALIDSLQTQITAATEQVAALQASIAQAATEQRSADMAALFTEMGRDLPTGDAAKPYMAMPAESFAAFAADMRAMKPRNTDRTLFSAQSTHMAATKTKPESQDKGSGLLDAVKKLAAKAQP